MTDPSPLGEAPRLSRPDDWFNQVCAALGLFDGARPVSPQTALWQEALPTIAALKANNPEAGILVEENRRVQQLWRDALARMVDANRRADGYLQRWHEVEAERKLLKQQILVAEGAARRGPQPEPAWQPIETADKDADAILLSDGVTVDVGGWISAADQGAEPEEEFRVTVGWWFLRGREMTPTLWMSLPAAPLVRSSAPPQPELDINRCAVCGWSLDPLGQFCKRGNCSQRPLPDRFYDPVRARAEYAPHLDNDPRVGLPPRSGAQE